VSVCETPRNVNEGFRDVGTPHTFADKAGLLETLCFSQGRPGSKNPGGVGYKNGDKVSQRNQGNHLRNVYLPTRSFIRSDLSIST